MLLRLSLCLTLCSFVCATIEAGPPDTKAGLYAIWYSGDPEKYLSQPYIKGGQIVLQWADVEVAHGQYDFSTIDEKVEPEYRPLDHWVIPDRVDPTNLVPWSRELADQYIGSVMDTYIDAFRGTARIFVRNGIPEELEAKYRDAFARGTLSWFHTSSEAEPRAQFAERKYQRFVNDCRSGKTTAYAEPWASTWGHHGGLTDDRWCSPPQWGYWRLLFDLHCGVSYIALYSTDMRVAIEGVYQSGFNEPLCLNFASAKNPGGGFLSGSQAQEECLARASGLHTSLVKQMPYYDVNRDCTTSLYTNHAIYSPCIPVFRDDEDSCLESPYQVSIVTSPAVNAGAVRKNEPESVPKIEETMRHRIDSVLAIARKHGHQSLVLGAWGCGVFANAPADIARWFRDSLISRPIFLGAFHRIQFAVLDFADGTPTFNAFDRAFAE